MSDKEACSRIEQRSVIKISIAEGCKAVKIHRRMQLCVVPHVSAKKMFRCGLNCLKKQGEELGMKTNLRDQQK